MSRNFALNEEVVEVNMLAESRNHLLNLMSEMLQKGGYVKDTFAEAILKREEVFSTGLPVEEIGVAIPHTDAIHVNSSMISLVTLKEPIEFCEMGNPEGKVDVKIVFMLAMKDSKSQLKMLTNLMDIVQDKELLKEIYGADKKHLIELINKKLCSENEEIC